MRGSDTFTEGLNTKRWLDDLVLAQHPSFATHLRLQVQNVE